MTTGTKVSGAHRTQGLGNAQLENKTKQPTKHTGHKKKRQKKSEKQKAQRGRAGGCAPSLEATPTMMENKESPNEPPALRHGKGEKEPNPKTKSKATEVHASREQPTQALVEYKFFYLDATSLKPSQIETTGR